MLLLEGEGELAATFRTVVSYVGLDPSAPARTKPVEVGRARGLIRGGLSSSLNLV